MRVSSHTIPYIYRSIPFLFYYSFYTIHYRLLLTLYIRPAYPAYSLLPSSPSVSCRTLTPVLPRVVSRYSPTPSSAATVSTSRTKERPNIPISLKIRPVGGTVRADSTATGPALGVNLVRRGTTAPISRPPGGCSVRESFAISLSRHSRKGGPP